MINLDYSKIIVGFSGGEEGVRFATHLHNCKNAMYINELDNSLVVGEGPGPNHLQFTAWPLLRVLYLAAVPVYVGHSLVDKQFDHRQTSPDVEVNSPEFRAFQILVAIEEDKLGSSSMWSHGTTMTPLTIGQLCGDGVPQTHGDCVELSRTAVQWVEAANQHLWNLQEKMVAEDRSILASIDWEAQPNSIMATFATLLTHNNNPNAGLIAKSIGNVAPHRAKQLRKLYENMSSALV